MPIKAYLFRAYPTTTQVSELRHIAGARRRVYNVGADEQARRWVAHQTNPESKLLSGSRSVTGAISHTINGLVRADEKLAWTNDVNSQIKNAAAGDLGEATKRFWDELKNPTRSRGRRRKMRRIERELGAWLPPAFPRAKKASSRMSFRIPGNALRVRYAPDADGTVWGYLRIPQAAKGKKEAWWLRFRRHRKPRGKPLEASVVLDGPWCLVAITHEFVLAKPPQHRLPGSAVGVDRNVTDLCGISDSPTGDAEGSVLPAFRDHPNVARLEHQLKHQQRLLSRKKGATKEETKSNNFRRQRKKVTVLLARLRRIRKNWVDRVAQLVSCGYETVVLEDLQIKSITRSARGSTDEPGKNVSQKRGLNREFLRNAPGRLGDRLVQKSAEYGGRVVTVRPEYTSQTCPRCRHVEAGNRNGTRFRCVRCGYEGHASIVAASNILARGLSDESSSSGGSPGVMRVETGSPSSERTSGRSRVVPVDESRKPGSRDRLRGSQSPDDYSIDPLSEVHESTPKKARKSGAVRPKPLKRKF